MSPTRFQSDKSQDMKSAPKLAIFALEMYFCLFLPKVELCQIKCTNEMKEKHDIYWT